MPDKSNRKADRNCSVASGSENWRSSLYGLQTPVNQKRRSRSTSPLYIHVHTCNIQFDGNSCYSIECVGLFFTVFDVLEKFLVELRNIFRSARKGHAVTFDNQIIKAIALISSVMIVSIYSITCHGVLVKSIGIEIMFSFYIIF